MKFARGIIVASAALAAPLALAPASAVGPSVQTGSYNGMTWTAESRIIGTGPTNAGHGETINTGSMPAYSGTVGIMMGGAFVCSGTLLSDHQTILTAGHCISSGGGTLDYDPSEVTVFFRNPGTGPDVQFYYGGPGYTTIDAGALFVNQDYTGDVIDQNDIALVRLSTVAPEFAEAYDLYTGSDLAGQVTNITGYGSTSSIGGDVGVNTTNPNRLGWFRQGDNLIDFRLGDEAFDDAWSSVLGEPSDQIAYSYLVDFDNGLAANDTACRVTQALGTGNTFCDLGVGELEANVAGGDSGGGSFIDGKVATVNSYGLSFGTSFGDIHSGLDSSYGEFSGLVPVWLHADWINSLLVPTVEPGVPEPGTWAMMIAGFAFVGASMRRRKSAVSFA